MSFDLSVTLKSGIAAKDRRERKETNHRCTQIYADLFWASIRAFVLKAILPLATWPDLAAVYLNLRIIRICVYPRLSAVESLFVSIRGSFFLRSLRSFAAIIGFVDPG